MKFYIISAPFSSTTEVDEPKTDPLWLANSSKCKIRSPLSFKHSKSSDFPENKDILDTISELEGHTI